MQCESVNVALLFLLGHYLETVDAVLLYSFQGLFFFLTCSTFCHRPHRRTLSSGCTVTGSHLSQGSSPASQVTGLKNKQTPSQHTLIHGIIVQQKRAATRLSGSIIAKKIGRKQNRCSAVVAGADLLRMSREDLIQICGPADGIRLFNTLKGR